MDVEEAVERALAFLEKAGYYAARLLCVRRSDDAKWRLTFDVAAWRRGAAAAAAVEVAHIILDERSGKVLEFQLDERETGEA